MEAIWSIGTGWTQAIARSEAMAAPLAGGAVLAFHLPIQRRLLAAFGA